MSVRTNRWLAALLGLAVLATAQAQDEAAEAAPAQRGVEEIPVAMDEEKAAELDTIEVTASRRAKMQRDIPGSVSAIRGQDLEAMHAQGLKDYVKLVPGVMYSDQGNEESVPVIRGIATSIGFGATPVTTGVYLDEMPFADLLSPSSVPDLNPFDLERVEILKGPQGTLFGSGALAGAVRYIVQKPNHGVFEGKTMVTFTDNSLADDISPVYAGALNVPLFGDALAIRAVGMTREDEGAYDMRAFDSSGNTLRDDRDADRSDQQSYRVLASWQALDDVAVSGFWFDQRTHHDDYGLSETGQPESNDFPFASPRDHDFSGGNVTASWDLPWLRVTGVYNEMKKHNYQIGHNEFGFGIENQNTNEYVVAYLDDVAGSTREVRITSPEGGDGMFEWLVGASRLDYGNDSFFYSYIGPDRPEPRHASDVDDLEKLSAQVFSTTDQVATEDALFGEVTARLGKHFEVTVGARQYETVLQADTALCGGQVVALFQVLCYPEHFHEVDDGVNPKFSIRYLHDQNMQVYVLAAKGFQFGGVQINPPAPGFPESAEAAGYHFEPYDSSELWNYELGLRTEWLERRLRFDLTFFYQDWRELQMTIAVPLQGTNVPFNMIANVARAHSEGVEIAFDVLPFAGAKWTTALAFMNAITDVPFDENAGDGGVPPGTRLPASPRFMAASVASYEHALPYFTSWLLAPTVTYSYGGQATDQIRPQGEIGDFAVLDARLALTNPGLRFQPELSLGVNNVTDVRGVTYHVGGTKPSDGTDYDYDHFNQPRTTVLSLSLRF